MYAVAGLTGNTGSAAAATLLAHGKPVRGLVRNVAKASIWSGRGVELVVADVLDVAALTTAFAGVEAAYLMIPPDIASEDPIGHATAVATAFRTAARAAKLPKIVFLSSEAAHLPSGTGPIRGMHIAEAILADAAPKVTFLRASYFQENWGSVFGLAAAQGILPTFLADLDARRSMVATDDIGRVAAELLIADDAPGLVELSGPTPYSARDAADAAAALVGKPVVPVQPPHDQWLGILTGAGLGVPYAALLVEMNHGINSGHVRFSGSGVQVKGRLTLTDTFKDWVAKA